MCFHQYWPIIDDKVNFLNNQIFCLLLISKHKNKLKNKYLRSISKNIAIDISKFLVYANSKKKELCFEIDKDF